MKKFLFFLVMVIACTMTYGQGNSLFAINVLTPKPGMRSDFEASWKLHLEKFHKTTDKRMVYEIMSGAERGSYVVVEGPFSYADMDNEKPNGKEHGLDLEKNLSLKIEPGSLNFMVRQRDTLSYNPDVSAEKVLITTTVLKDGKMGDYVTELRRAAIISAKLNSPFSYNIGVKQLAGSSPAITTVRYLKNGYKEMEPNYFQLPSNGFRDAYVKDYGQEAWDKRLKLMVDDVVSREQHFEKFRPDLSSK